MPASPELDARAIDHPLEGDADRRVRIYEVGPRDGLQNEPTPVPTETKLGYIRLLLDAGLREIEATSFVSPRAIPQLADADELLPRLDRPPGVRYPVLVPNLRGLERAERAGADAIAVFTAATDAFTERNIGRTVAESLAAFRPVLERAAGLGWWRRGYVSTAFGCPYTGSVRPERAVEVGLRLWELGVDEVCFGDTIGVGVPSQVGEIAGRAVEAGIPRTGLAFHFHDTRGTALANVVAGLEAGVRCFDAASGGTGGCPYAPGAAGNLGTEDLVYLLDRLGFEHGVSLEGVLRAARFITRALGRPLATKVGQAGGWDPTTGRPIGRAPDAEAAPGAEPMAPEAGASEDGVSGAGARGARSDPTEAPARSGQRSC
ncbi:MAG TPA: hydroxymethylglutaryl-CoA lyase [Candidatus Limnocylindrales bacterium]|nr:hydroxymethylglutaryl-CoA lyase [Candidatus Limnocylindrales bacterium]